jgi:hypothetical protein
MAIDERDPNSRPAPIPDLGGYGFALGRVWLTTGDNAVRDSGLEGRQRFQVLGVPLPTGSVGPPWATEGPGPHLDSARRRGAQPGLTSRWTTLGCASPGHRDG